MFWVASSPRRLFLHDDERMHALTRFKGMSSTTGYERNEIAVNEIAGNQLRAYVCMSECNSLSSTTPQECR